MPGFDKTAMVIGGGIAGITAAVELADIGCNVVLVERSASLGGRVAQLHRFFPKLCPPACGLEMHYRRIRNRAEITVLTLAEIAEVAGEAGAFEVTVRVHPRYVTGNCTLCGACADACTAERADEFNCGMALTKAAYLPYGMAYPPLYAIDRSACFAGCDACETACTYGAVNLSQEAGIRKFSVSAIVAATGWKPYDAANLDNLGSGKLQNVVTNLMLERMAASDGPSGGANPASIGWKRAAHRGLRAMRGLPR
jgi:heterodisulfide reductase subunit A-like polyferredoxin